MTDPATAPRDAMLAEIEASFTRLTAFLDGLDPALLDGPTDAAGWTAKDHVIHLAVWAGSMIAVLDGAPRWEAMGVDRVLWRTLADGYDAINEHIRQANRHRSAADARRALEEAHRALTGRVAGMSVFELSLPYKHYQPWATDRTDPLFAYVRGNTEEHYDEHRAYIAAIVGAA